MHVSLSFTAIAFGLALTAVGCAAPPTAEVDAAKASVDRAAANRGHYAAESLKTAEEARAALDVEMKTQEGK